MSFLSAILDGIGIILIIISIILDFVAANKADANDMKSASNYAKAAGGIAIIGLIVLFVGLIIGAVTNKAVSSAINFANDNPDLVKAALV